MIKQKSTSEEISRFKNNAFRPFSKKDIETSIPARFEAQVRRDPERLAVKLSHEALTYGALNAVANRIAHGILAARGAGLEPVALLLDQGVGAVASILGTLKAGKIYVALEPAAGKAELAQVLADCRPGLLVTAGRHLAKARAIAGHGVLCLCLDDLGPSLAEGDPGLELAPGQPAYIFYTSGSTGAPKGVVDCHRNVLHNVMRYTNTLGISRADQLSMIQSPAFSGTVSSVFSALLNGAAVFPFDLQNRGISPMADWIRAEEITIFHSVPMIFEGLMASGRKLPSLRLIRLEGDQAHARQAALFQRHFGNHCLLVNGLGTTETGLLRQFFLAPDDPLEGPLLPIGRPVEDMELQLLDDAGKPVEAGAVGEIAVASRYLALGYWQRPALTAAAFQADPADPGGRIYRSGDLGRFRPDGCLEHLGRKGFQVKIRGRRIEVAESEEALRGLPEIAQAVVLQRNDRPGQEQLVAYLVAKAGATPSVGRLRRGLTARLSEIMIPARYVFLEELPLDRNGKVARKDLPPPGRERPPMDQPYLAPASPLEASIAACFRDCLGIDEIGRSDDFFELGGDSLAATELIILIEERTGMICSTAFFFDDPCLAGIAGALAGSQVHGHLVPLRAKGSLPPLFLFHNMPGHLLEYRSLVGLLDPERPVFGLQNHAASSGDAPLMDVEAMAGAYLQEINARQPEGPYHLCGHCFGGMLAFETARQLKAMGQEVALLGLIDTAFYAGPLDRTQQFLALGKHRQRLAKRTLGGQLAYLGEILVNTAKRSASALRRRSPLRSEAPSISEINEQAQSRYHPQGYDGSLVLFCLGEPYNQLGWKTLALGGFKLIQLPWDGAGDERPHLLQEPQVQDLAKAMEASMAPRPES